MDDWCGTCGTQLEELLPCKVCSDMFCGACLEDGCCANCASEANADEWPEDDEPQERRE